MIKIMETALDVHRKKSGKMEKSKNVRKAVYQIDESMKDAE
jgi:hypothetical protein